MDVYIAVHTLSLLEIFLISSLDPDFKNVCLHGLFCCCYTLFINFLTLGSLAIQSIYFNTYNDPTYFIGLTCNGSEDHLFNCAINTSAPACSSTRNDANVICPG